MGLSLKPLVLDSVCIPPNVVTARSDASHTRNGNLPLRQHHSDESQLVCDGSIFDSLLFPCRLVYKWSVFLRSELGILERQRDNVSDNATTFSNWRQCALPCKLQERLDTHEGAIEPHVTPILGDSVLFCSFQLWLHLENGYGRKGYNPNYAENLDFDFADSEFQIIEGTRLDYIIRRPFLLLCRYSWWVSRHVISNEPTWTMIWENYKPSWDGVSWGPLSMLEFLWVKIPWPTHVTADATRSAIYMVSTAMPSAVGGTHVDPP